MGNRYCMPVCRNLCSECRSWMLQPLFPDFSHGLSIPSIAPIFCKLQFKYKIFTWILLWTLCVLICRSDGYDRNTCRSFFKGRERLIEEGKLPKIKGALLQMHLQQRAVLGTSTTTTFVERFGTGGRKNRSYSSDNSIPLPHCSCHRFSLQSHHLLYSTGIDHCRTLHADEYYKHWFLMICQKQFLVMYVSLQCHL